MKTALKLLFVLAFGLLTISHANSGPKQTRNVKAGQKTLIYQFAVYLSTCGHVSYPEFSGKGAKNGTLTSVNGSFISDSGQCKGKRLRSTNVYYTPNRGFRGTEKVKALFGYPRDSDSDWGTVYETVRFTINVK